MASSGSCGLMVAEYGPPVAVVESISLQKHSVCQLTEKCIYIDWKKLHHAARQ